MRRVKQLRSGPRTDICNGLVTLTDYRLLYDSAGLGLDINHRRVLDIKLYSNGFEVVTSGKGSGVYLPNPEPQLFSRMYAVAIRKANQTIVCKNPTDQRGRFRETFANACGNVTVLVVRSARRPIISSSITSFRSRKAGATPKQMFNFFVDDATARNPT